jgi:hypothetical protein
MHYNDHEPAHFHAIYAERDVQVRIEPLQFLRGSLPRRAQRMVLEWAKLHQLELMANWTLGREQVLFERIEPLE